MCSFFKRSRPNQMMFETNNEFRACNAPSKSAGCIVVAPLLVPIERIACVENKQRSTSPEVSTLGLQYTPPSNYSYFISIANCSCQYTSTIHLTITSCVLYISIS